MHIYIYIYIYIKWVRVAQLPLASPAIVAILFIVTVAVILTVITAIIFIVIIARFPNINPYRQPFYSMIQLTDPYLNLFRLVTAREAAS